MRIPAYPQQEQHKSLLSGVDRSLLSWLLVLQKSLKIYSCESGCPRLRRTVGAQCKHHRRSDDILPTSQLLTVPETSAQDSAEIDHSFLCSLSPSPFLFLYLFDIWLAGRDGGEISLQSRPFWAMVSLGYGIQRPITRLQSTWADLSYSLLTECTLVQLLQRRAFGKVL